MKSLYLLALISFSGEGRIDWIDQPIDFYARVGAMAVFNCSYTGSGGFPWWNINNRSYDASQLPPRHSYHDYMLSVRDVELSDNSSTYQCFFVSGVYSTTGRLYCYIEEETTTTPQSYSSGGSTGNNGGRREVTHVSATTITLENSTTNNGIQEITHDSATITTTFKNSTINVSTGTTQRLQHKDNDEGEMRFIIIYSSIGSVSLVIVMVVFVMATLLIWRFWKLQHDSESLGSGSLKSLELDANPSYGQVQGLALDRESKSTPDEEPFYECIY